MNNSFCPHCRSGHDPVLKDSTWSCGVRFNDLQWRTKECYKRNLELANERIKRLEGLLAEEKWIGQNAKALDEMIRMGLIHD